MHRLRLASYGIKCSTEYEVADLRIDTTDGITVSRTVRVPDGPSWSSDVSDHDPSVSKILVEWRVTSDLAAPVLPMLSAPLIIAADFSPGVIKEAWADNLYTIGVMPRFMRPDDKQPSIGTRLAFDGTRSGQTTLAALGLYLVVLLIT